MLSRTSLILSAMQDDMSLYEKFNKEMGRQFLREFRGLPGLGKQVMTPCFGVIDIVLFVYAKLIDRSKICKMSIKFFLKNSEVYPSSPRLLSFFYLFKASRSSLYVIGPSMPFFSSSDRIGMSSGLSFSNKVASSTSSVLHE
jgi:hypothetical protein